MDDRPLENPDAYFPEEPIRRLVRPVSRFFRIESAGGGVLLICAATAVTLANSPWAADYLAFWESPAGIRLGGFLLQHTLKEWINDALMVVFFFVVGLEIKRELMLGELRDRRAALLPAAAALGGMIVPALFYLALERDGPGRDGWGIPMATDIAFVVGCLALLGSRVPSGLRALLLSLAIVDDLGAIIVIAVGYTENLHEGMLVGGLLGVGVVLLFQRLGIRSIAAYTVCGACIWFGFHESGVHATVAGVILGLMTPVRPWLSDHLMVKAAKEVADFFQGETPRPAAKSMVMENLAWAARETVSPLERLENRLHPWVSFGVMPLFALANAGVPLHMESLRESVAAAVVVGLGFGKPLGIVLFSWLAVRLGLGRLPDGVGWKMLVPSGVLAGIGFTMSLFIAELALDRQLLDAAKLSILLISTVCAVAGLFWLRAALTPPRSDAPG